MQHAVSLVWCQLGNNSNDDLHFPDIQSVSYDSDGKNLNATLWLNSQFREPPLNDTIDTFQEELKITVSDTNSTVQEYSDLKLARLLEPSIVPTLEENTSMLSGIQADRISYTCQNTTKWVELNRNMDD